MRLRIPALLKVGDQVTRDVTIFLDTGSEISLVRRGLIPDELLQQARCPIQLMAANGQLMKGGSREVCVELRLTGVEAGVEKKVALVTPHLSARGGYGGGCPPLI